MNTGEKIKVNSMLLMTALIWGSSFAVRKMGLEYMGPFFFNSLRFLAAFLFVMVLYLSKSIFGRRHSNLFHPSGSGSSTSEAGSYRSMPYQIAGGGLVGIAYGLACNLQQWGMLT